MDGGNGPFRGRARYWLITRRTEHTPEVFTTGSDHERTLPVFSFPEEARLFLCCEAQEDGWRVRESDPNELLSVLSGPYADVKNVALDPLPDMVAGSTLALVSVSQREFTKRLINGRTHPPHGVGCATSLLPTGPRLVRKPERLRGPDGGKEAGTQAQR